MQTLAIAGVGVLAGVLVWRVVHQAPPPKVGGPAPLFALAKLRGTGSVSLRSLRGKTVVLNFFASWCDPCKREAPALEQVWRQDRSSNVVVLGVDTNDSNGDATRFVEAHGLTYPIVVDHNGVVAASRYDIANLPVTYVLDAKGRIVGGEILGPVTDSPFAQTFRRYLQAARQS